MKLYCTLISLLLASAVFAQNPDEDKIKTTNFIKFKELVSTKIPGAVTFSQPELITGTKQEIRTEKHGLIYPVFFDWNKDGKKDLMLGEFETGETGSNIKVYLNRGSNKNPKYTGEYFYATDVKGDTITNYQWCCIGIHPRIVDLDQDGYEDILSGQYNPGAISWWRGSKDGFLPRQFVEQEGYVEGARLSQSDSPWLTTSNSYWNYTTSDFADFNGDGLLDLFVGGSGDMRVALNEGTKEKPKFGYRNYLHHVDGGILEVKRPSQETINEQAKYGRYLGLAGVWKTYIKPVDWDKDGVLDLLVTYEYKKKYHNAIEFYRGVQTDKGLRFERRQPLVTAKGGSKAFPGVQPMITLIDYNDDGVEDIVFGLSIPTINGFEVADEIAWAWAGDLEIEMPGKDAGRQLKYSGGLEGVKKKLEDPVQGPMFRRMMLGKLDDLKYLTMRHRGYVFVMYGKKATDKAVAKKDVVAAEAEKRKIIPNETVKTGNVDGPVGYKVKGPERMTWRGEYTLEASVSFDKGWHGYVDNVKNKKDGFIPTTVKFELPQWLEPVGEVEAPAVSYKGLAEVYKETVTFKQKVKMKRFMPNVPRPERIDLDSATEEEKAAYEKQMDVFREAFAKLPRTPNEFDVNVKVKWQTCDDNICLPPKEVNEAITVSVQGF
ncbi:VCBS repeat-containing protein [Seonamhaeicola sp.]|uniref:FG-GAP repeat domain-containing protein n=1 Tax=Seonamhaeicola sp. TaxID=1912245 RepID=UPI002638C326|nr:VCBS repeat-containing protein [Seonamhaeicola sp.]